MKKHHRSISSRFFLVCRIGLLALLALAGVGVLAAIIIWRLSLPDLNEPAALPELQARVDIYRDTHGVPHIFAANRNDALRALGYVHASERFFQMEMNRRAGQGRLAEAAGKDAVNLDRMLRGLDLYRLAETSIAALSPDARAALDAYCAGVNSWLESHQHGLPLEFLLLNIKPERWKPADSMVWGKLMALRLSVNMAKELRRAALLTVQTHEVVERLYPPYPGDAPVTMNPIFARRGVMQPMPPLLLRPVSTLSELKLPPRQPASPGKSGAHPSPAPAQKSKLKAKPKKHSAIDPELGAAYVRLAEFWPFQTPGASNEWVIDGTRSATGQPMLANDPHLGLETPVMWYLARIVTPDLMLTGATAPGLPVFLLKQNSHIAWGFTTTNSEVQDIFVETIDPQDPAKYLTPSSREKFTVRTEIIKVKGESDVVMTVRGTRHGPVISDFDDDAAKLLTGKGYVLALAFTGLGGSDTTLEALLRLNMARNWDEFQNALQLYQTPPQNIFYADRAGHIGFTSPGLVPVRKEYNGRYAVPGASGRYDWNGFVPFTYAPRLFDPDSGAIFNANNAVIRPGLYWFGREWEAPYRAKRVQEMLRAKPQFTIQDMQAMQADILSLPARELSPYLLKIKPATGQESRALDLLRNWDFTMRADRPEPLIFEWWLMRLYDALVRPPFGKLGATLGQYNAQIVTDILQNPRGWCDTLLAAKSADCAPQITEAFRQTLQELMARYGNDVSQWRWSDEHFAPLENKVMRHLPLFDRLFGLQTPSNGGHDTVNRGGNADQIGARHPLAKTHGTGFRGIYDLSNPNRSQFMIATGQSAHPLSPFYDNLLPLWKSGQNIEITGTQEQLAAQHRGHLVLLPD